jgi:heat shock protein HtpX
MWDQIRANRRRSAILVISMALLLFVVGYVVGLLFIGNGIFGLILAGIIWIVMTLVAYYGANDIFLSISKAKKIEKKDHPRLFNVVEEMKIASGLSKMQDIYIIDTPALNAFATGRDPDHAAVAITSGLLQKLNRDELQGVIAHEMAHIKNRDVLLMMMAGVMMGTIVMIADIVWYYLLFSFLMGGGRSNRRSGGGEGGYMILIVFVVAIVLMIIAPILAQLIYFAISRKREYLADASAAQFTRYPDGLASALEKLSSSTAELPSANRTTAPMYIVNPLHKKGMKVSDLSSTHPPISERIRILRSMGGGVSLVDYDKAFRQVHKGGGSVVPASALGGEGAGLIPVRESKAPETDPGEIDRARETTDVLWKLNKYTFVTCSNCGTKLKLPPKFKSKTVKCPHCGTPNPVEQQA